MTRTAQRPQVSIVVVLHNSANEVRACVQSAPPNVEIIVVDNGSTDDGVLQAHLGRPDVKIVRCANRGFGAGCNVGTRISSGEIIVFLNPDCVVEQNAIAALVSVVQSDPSSVAGPQISGPEGEIRFICRRRSTPVHEVIDLLPPLRRVVPEAFRRDRTSSDPIYMRGGDVDYLQGACLAVARNTFFDVGGFDETFFLYSEEEDFCERVRERGGRCIYVPSARVRHLWGASTKKAGNRPVRERFRSALILYRRRGRHIGVASVALITAALAVRTILIIPVHLMFGVERDFRWSAAAFRGIYQGMRSPLHRSLGTQG